MEIRNSRTTGPSQDLVCTDHHGDFGQEIRSYSCTFCNRGFSNAQALGGHMNVHRKDRARLQESIQEPLITTDTTKGMNSFGQAEEVQSSSDEKGEGIPKRTWRTSTEVDSLDSPIKKDIHSVVNSKKPALELSLCFDSSSASDSYIRSNKISSLSSSSLAEVDLELRLGMESESTARDRII